MTACIIFLNGQFYRISQAQRSNQPKIERLEKLQEKTVLHINGSIFGKRYLLAIDHDFILELCSNYEMIS